jgi:hypothetical protein
LSELDFVVQHRPCFKMSHVDALSRHVGTVTNGSALDRENVLRGQAKEAFSSKITVSCIGENQMVNIS